MNNRARAGVVAAALLAAAGGCSSKSGGTGGSAGAAPYDTNEQACDPLTPPAITLGAVVGVGKDAAGTLYVDAESGVFLPDSGQLVRQNVIGTGGEFGNNEFLFSFVAPGADVSTAQNLLVETQGTTATKMALGPADSKAFLDQSPPGITLLTLVDASSVSGMKVVNTPNVIEYLADVANGDVVLTTIPMNSADWTPATGETIFYGPPDAVAERKVTDFQASLSNSGTMTFLVGSTPYVLSFGTVPAPDAGPLGQFELQSLTPKGGAPLDVTLRSPTPTKLPARLSFTCLAGG
jgi:hypothetical protein